MKNYLYSFLLGTLLFFVVTIPVLADVFDDHVEFVDFAAPQLRTVSMEPPDFRIEAIHVITIYAEDLTSKNVIPLDQLIPRPGWQNNSTQETIIQKRKTLLSQNLRK